MHRIITAIISCLIPITALADDRLLDQAPEQVLKEVEKKPATAQVERGGLLLRKGEVEIEPSFTYSHISESQIFIDGFSILPVLVVGEVGVQRIRKELMMGALTGRVGLIDNLQMEVRVPYRYEFDRFSRPEMSPPFEETLFGGHIGDIEGGIFRQILWEGGSSPNLILGLWGKSRTGKDVFETRFDPSNNIPEEVPTGSGFYSLRGSATLSKTYDPAVLFATSGYTHNFPRDNVGVTATGATIDVDPGDTAEYGFGLAYALNNKISLSGQFIHAFTLSSKVDGVKVVNSAQSAASFRMGTVWAVTKRQIVDLSVSIGLTRDAPDAVVELRLPLRLR